MSAKINFSKRNSFLFLLIGLFISATSMKCRHENENDCLDTTPTSAAFKVYEWIEYTGFKPGDPEWVTLYGETDSIINHTRFQALPGMELYRWRIGNEATDRTGSSVYVNFYLNFDTAYGTIPIKLITNKTPNYKCYPLDVPADTVVKNIHVVKLGQSPLIGKFKGHFEHKADSEFTIEIKLDSLSPGSCILSGLQDPKWCSLSGNKVHIGIGMYMFPIDDHCLGGGYGKLDKKTRVLTLDYMGKFQGGAVQPRLFTGTKL